MRKLSRKLELHHATRTHRPSRRHHARRSAQLIDKRLVRLERLLNDSAISAQVVLTKEKYRHRAEIVVHARGEHVLRGNGEGTTLADRRSARRPTRSSSRRRRSKASGPSASGSGAGARTVDGRPTATPSTPARRPRIVRATRYAVKPMSVEDAALQVDATAESVRRLPQRRRPTRSASSTGARTATWD